MELLDVARHWAADPASWPVAPRFDPADRWYTRLADADGHEAWLLTWLPGQQTGRHDHGGSAGAFLVVSGQLTRGHPHRRAARARVLPAGTGRRFGARHVHRVVNAARGRRSACTSTPPRCVDDPLRLVGGSLRVAEVERAGADW